MTAPGGETGLSPAAEAVVQAIRREHSRRGWRLPDETWSRVLAEAVEKAVAPVIAAAERERIALLAEEYDAFVPVTREDTYGQEYQGSEPFADVIREQVTEAGQ